MKTAFDKAWDYVWTKLFYDKTNTFYDYRTSLDSDGALRHLPTPKEILASVPNPCGWNAGMENGAIFAGIMLDVIACKYQATKDQALHAYAEKVINGLKLLTSVTGIRGFLARNVLLDNGKYYYNLDTSRDQYTYVIYGAHKYMNCALCTNDERNFLCDMLVSFAEYAEKCVTEENGYRLLRTDGGKGFVTCMRKYLSPHEQLRLPMFYISAWKASGNPHWLDKYKEVRDEALDKALELTTKYWDLPFALEQTQNSAKFCYELETDESYKAKYLQHAQQVISFIETDKARKIVEEAEETNRKFDTLCDEWRKKPMTYLYFWGAPLDGLGYYMPELSKLQRKDMCDIHLVANPLIMQLKCPNYAPKQENIDLLQRIAECIDYENHATEAIFNLLEAYWNLQAHND